MRWIGLKAHVVPALAVLLCLLMGVPHGVSAQTETSMDLVGGQTVNWNSPWALSEDLTTSGDGFDLLALETQLGLVGVGSYGFPISGSDVRDVAIEAFAGEVTLQQVDRGDYDNVSYSLDIANADAFAFGLFTLVVESPDGTLLSIMMAPLNAFQSEMESAQAAVTIDGSSIFNGVDAAAMQGFLDTAPQTQGDAPAPTPAATQPAAPTQAPAPTPAPTTESGSSGGLVGGINTELQGDEPTPATTDAAPTPASDGTTAPAPPLPNGYTIPSSGVTVSWSNEWDVSEQAQDSIQLESPELIAFMSVLDLGQVPPGGDVEALASSITQQPGLEGSTVVAAVEAENGQRNVIVLAQEDASGTMYLIYDVTFSDSGATALLLTVFEEDLGRVVDAVPSTVQLDGQPVFQDLRELVPELFPNTGP